MVPTEDRTVTMSLTNPKRVQPSAEVVALLDLAVEALSDLDGADDRMIRFREANRLLDELAEQVRSSGLPDDVEDRVVDARHCLRMGKPRESLVLLQRLQDDLRSFWTE